MSQQRMLAGVVACATALLTVACEDTTPPPRGEVRNEVAPWRPDPAIRNGRVAEAVGRIIAAGDAQGLPFVVIDKEAAHLYILDEDGRLRAETPVLLGSARGDRTVPGIGDRPISQVMPHERTTPAGRFIGEIGRNARNEDVVWVDYDAAVSIHRVITSNSGERRLSRLASPSPEDNRISYGCINVWPEFYETHLRPAYLRARLPIYILPEVEPFESVIALRGGALAQVHR